LSALPCSFFTCKAARFVPIALFDLEREAMRAGFKLLLFLGILLIGSGCNRGVPVADVNGVIKMDGKPVPHVRIMFLPDPQHGTTGPFSAGLSDDEGRFKLTCEDEREGAVVGWHRVVLMNSGENLYRTPRHGRREEDEPVPKAPKAKKAGPKVPEKYGTAAKTPLEMEVKATKNDLELVLTK